MVERSPEQDLSMSYEEMEAKFPDEWVLAVVTQVENSVPTRGVPVWHDKDTASLIDAERIEGKKYSLLKYAPTRTQIPEINS